jgi:hypothetical protein
LVEADEDTDVEVGGDAGTGPDAGGAAKSWRKTRSAMAKQSVTTAAAAVSAVKAAKKKKKRKRKPSPPQAVEIPAIPTPKTMEVESEEEEEDDDDEATDEPLVVQDRPVRRSLSPAAKSQWELTPKTTEDALRQSLEAQRIAAAAQAKMLALIRPQFFRSKPRVPTVTR